MMGEMNVLLTKAVVKGYHECPFAVRMGVSFVLEKKVGDRGEAFRVVSSKQQLGNLRKCEIFPVIF